MQKRDYDKAYDAFEMAGTYSNALSLLKEVRYIQAKELVAAGKKEEAMDILVCLLDYKDVYDMIQKDPELSQMLDEYEPDGDIDDAE